MKKSIKKGIKALKSIKKVAKEATLEGYDILQFRLRYWSLDSDIFNPIY